MPSTARLCLALLCLAITCLNPPVSSAAEPALATPGQKVSWSGELTVPDPAGCGDVTSNGCIWHDLGVNAAKGAWITVSAEGATYLRVAEAGAYVASNGEVTNTRESPNSQFTVTFQQLRAGKVTYQVGVSTLVATSQTSVHFTVTGTLAGQAFDREGECFVKDSGLGALTAPDDGKPLGLSIRFVADPKDATVVRQAGKTLVEIYGRIGVAARVSYDFFPIAPTTTGYPFDQVKVRYHGVRPKGIDVVHVMTDEFAGGYADCLGGIAYPELGFSTGNAHYNVQGLANVDKVPGGLIAAHEIGHELGGQHQMVSCIEAAPQQVQQPASDGWIGACTQMGPAALQDSETWSTLERASVRAMVRAYAGKNR